MSTFTLVGNNNKRVVFTIGDTDACVACGHERITTTVEQARAWYRKYVDMGYVKARLIQTCEQIIKPRTRTVYTPWGEAVFVPIHD